MTGICGWLFAPEKARLSNQSLVFYDQPEKLSNAIKMLLSAEVTDQTRKDAEKCIGVAVTYFDCVNRTLGAKELPGLRNSVAHLKEKYELGVNPLEYAAGAISLVGALWLVKSALSSLSSVSLPTNLPTFFSAFNSTNASITASTVFQYAAAAGSAGLTSSAVIGAVVGTALTGLGLWLVHQYTNSSV